MKVVLAFDGRSSAEGTPLLCHNERLADPLDPVTRSVAEISGKRKKTEADHLELARREFEGGLYLYENGPGIPSGNMLRCIEDGARRIRKGKDVNRGIVPLEDYADLDYSGPRDVDSLWQEGYWLRKGVGVGTSRVIRTRACFKDWQLSLAIEVDPEIWDIHQLSEVCGLAGKYAGLGDMRPIHGRCTITATPAAEWLKLGNGDLSAVALARKTRIEQIVNADAARNGRHAGTRKKVAA